MRNILIILAVIAASTIFALAVTQSDNAGNPHGMPNMAMMPGCLMQFSGADLAVADVDNGIAVTITTKSGDVADLRRRVENQAKMHSDSAGNGMHGDMMPLFAKYEEIPNGAQVTLTPKDPSQLEDFRTKVRQHVEHMKTSDHEMMHGMMPGMTHGMMGGDKK